MNKKESRKSSRYLFDIDKYNEFPRWYQEILREAEIVDTRYPVKGMYVWKPYGYKALKNIQKVLIDILEETGHEEAYFPTLIPESVFSKEKEFLEGFGGETYIIEGTKTRKFSEKLYVRPTSETVMYYMWSLWIKSWRDLPLKMYQVVNVFRYETKATHPILRVREIVSFIEAHTAHATMDDAERQVREAIEIYKKFYDKLLIPYFIVLTPPWDTFSGAEYNYDFIAPMPDGKALELGSVINLGQKFAKAFNIKFKDKDGSDKYVYQTCYGISERSLGIVLAIHGDNKGLIFPPAIAPIQVVIVPIATRNEKDIIEYAYQVKNFLKQQGVRVIVDDDPEHTPGWKYYYWDMRGVPTRIEVGRRELTTKTVTIARRDKREKKTVELDNIVTSLYNVWKDIERELYTKAMEHVRRMTIYVDGEKLKDVEDRKGLIVTPWDETEECAEELESVTGKNVLGTIVESPIELPKKGKSVCGEKEVGKFALLGITY